MKIVIIQLGKTDKDYLKEGLSDYYSRIRKILPLEVNTVNELKNTGSNPGIIKKQEEREILKYVKQGDFLVLMDERGQRMNSRSFAAFIQKSMNRGPRRILFVIGGAWGTGDEIKKKADKLISLSDMTFSHQLVRLLLAEQLYRALTIIKGIPYHHD